MVTDLKFGNREREALSFLEIQGKAGLTRDEDSIQLLTGSGIIV